MGILDGKVAFVSGGTSGIGEDCVYGMASEGAQVMFCGRSVENGLRVVERCAKNGWDVRFTEADLTIAENNKTVIEETVKAFGRIDIVLANSGGGSENLELDVMSNNQWMHDMAIYIHSPMLLSKYAILHMLAQGTGGSIIFMSSASPYKLSPKQGGYASGKAANWQLAKQISLEYCRSGIRANCILPSATKTKMISENPSIAAMVSARANSRRFNELKDVTDAVLYLASDASRAVTETQLIVDFASSAGIMPDLIAGTCTNEH